jgi:hypothetical protein
MNMERILLGGTAIGGTWLMWWVWGIAGVVIALVFCAVMCDSEKPKPKSMDPASHVRYAAFVSRCPPAER